jgi:ABC-type uncharacterized transport system involved in gliding motility auxiliary subunit
MKKDWRKLAPVSLYLSIAAALVSMGLYFIRRDFDIYLQISLGVFVLGVAVFIILDPGRVKTALTGRQARYGSNAALLSLAFLGILVVVNYFVYQNTQRWDLTEDKVNTLADETLEILDALPDNVVVQAFFSPGMNPEIARSLLEDYKFNSNGMINFEFIDPVEDPIAAEAAEIVYDGSVVFRMGEQKEIVTNMVENEFSGALVRLMSGEVKVIYLITGHGEASPEDSGEEGFSEARRVLESRNYKVEPLNLLAVNNIPDDAAALIIAGPVQPFEPFEVALLDTYLSADGNLILMQDSPIFTDIGDQIDYLTDYLKDSWNIILGQDLIVDQASSLGVFVPIGLVDDSHPITLDLQGIATGFPTARSVGINPTEISLTPKILVSTFNNESWAETDLDTLESGGDIAFDEEIDLLGPVPMAVAAEDIGRQSRVVVFGDINFALNSWFTFFGNGDLFMGSVDWVIGQEDLISLTPKVPTERYILPPQPYIMPMIQLLVVFLIPGAVLILGIVVWFRKRQRG